MDACLCDDYRKEPMSKEETLEEIEDCAGSQFDPELAEEFVGMMKS